MTEREQAGPFGLGATQREMLGLLNEAVSGARWVSGRQAKVWRPPTDVYETEDCVVVKVEIAGMEEKDFALSLLGKKLTIAGVREDQAAKLGYQQMEILYGQFETVVYLPRAVDEEKVEATYGNGFLYVQLQKARPRTVPITHSQESE